MNWAAWQPDPRQAYEYDLCRLRPVWRTLTARARATNPFFCDHCSGLIVAGQKYDAGAVSGAGVGGYLHPRRVHCPCQGDYIVKRNRRYAELYGIILSICGKCGRYMGHQDGQGSHGLSGTYCEECFKAWTAGRTDGEAASV